jgi:hypothetical protein
MSFPEKRFLCKMLFVEMQEFLRCPGCPIQQMGLEYEKLLWKTIRCDEFYDFEPQRRLFHNSKVEAYSRCVDPKYLLRIQPNENVVANTAFDMCQESHEKHLAAAIKKICSEE